MKKENNLDCKYFHVCSTRDKGKLNCNNCALYERNIKNCFYCDRTFIRPLGQCGVPTCPDCERKTDEERMKIRDDDILSKIDDIHSPSHYTWIPGIECKDVAKHFSYFSGNALKYIWRAGKKNKSTQIEDLKKAIECLENEIKFIEENNK